MMAVDNRPAFTNNSVKDSESTNRVIRLLTELGLLGLFIRLLQVIIIISILQFSSIFKNPSQLNILIPIFICALIILASVTFAEIQCERYMARLDQRLAIITSTLGLNKQVNQNKNYLQKVFLPVLIGTPALPFIIIFLSITTPYLFAIVTISVIISGIVVRHYNQNKQKPEQSQINTFVDKMMKEEVVNIPVYLLRKSEAYNHPSQSLGINVDENAILEDFEYQDISNSSKKKQYLSLIRKSTRACILTAAVLLSILQITSIAKIAGFLIISGAFRSACLALFEFTTSSRNIFPFSEAFSRIRLALLYPMEIVSHIEEQYKLEQHNIKVFNDRYKEGFNMHPYLRLKQVTLKDNLGNIIIENITGRVQLNSVTIVKVDGSSLVNNCRKLFKDMCSERSLETYSLNGDFVLSSNKLNSDFVSMMPRRNPWEIRITSNSLIDYFSEIHTNECNALIQKHELYQYIISGKENISLSTISNKQANRMRAMICLLTHIIEYSIISISPFTLDIFDEQERDSLTAILYTELKKKSVSLILFTRHKQVKGYPDKCYEINRDQLLKI